VNFVTIFNTVKTDVLGVVKAVEPIVETILPVSIPIFSIFDQLTGAVKTAEVAMPSAPGVAKAAAVTSNFQNDLAFIQQILATGGQQLTYDSAAVQKAITDQVAVFNDFATIMASFKVVPLPTPKTP
jgi:hypothetical protein